MKKITTIVFLLLGFAKVEAQNQNYLPLVIKGVPQAKFIEACKAQMGISDEDLPVHAQAIWVSAWLGRVNSQNGVITITPVTWEWNDGHFYNGTAWVQGSNTATSPGNPIIVNALGDLQIRAQQILGVPLNPQQNDFPNVYLQRILDLLAQVGSKTTATKSDSNEF